MVVFQKNISPRGFGLIELIVSMSIVTIVTGIVLARHNAFSGAVLLRNQAYEIAFLIREAQQLAVSGQTSDVGSVQKQRYGVEFSTADSGVVNRGVIRLYKDNNDNGVFDGPDESLRLVALDRRFRISALGGQTSRRIIFTRPLFDAEFNPASGSSLGITIAPVAGGSATRTVVVTASGQVTVQ